ncbi:MAG: hypothetical protein ACFCGT_11495, partial [Sandaracinaceae bacterium]
RPSSFSHSSAVIGLTVETTCAEFAHARTIAYWHSMLNRRASPHPTTYPQPPVDPTPQPNSDPESAGDPTPQPNSDPASTGDPTPQPNSDPRAAGDPSRQPNSDPRGDCAHGSSTCEASSPGMTEMQALGGMTGPLR